MKEEFEVLVKRRSHVGEGSIWDANEQRLYWVDILHHKLFIYNPATGENREIDTCQPVGAVVPRAKGGLALALHHGFAWIDLDTEKITPIADPEQNIPGTRFNDGKCDPAGRFWAGTMEFFGEERDKGALYCLDVEHTVTKKISPVSISNGIVWTGDHRTMYYIDTMANNVRAWDFELDTAEIKNERVVIEGEPPGHFDGMSIDQEGMLWIAIYQGWAVRRYNPENGILLETIDLPVSQVTSCAFGGESLNELYITSASQGFDDRKWQEQPLSGSLLRIIKKDVKGVPSYAYKG